MESSTISEIIEKFDKLSPEDKEYTRQILEKNIVETKRAQLIQRVKDAKKNLSGGKVKRGSYRDLYKDLEDD